MIGNVKKYSIYIDESGIPELTDDSSSHVILCGVLIDSAVEEHFLFLINRIKSKYNLDQEKHIHTVDIFEKKFKDSYLGLTTQRRKNDLRKSFQEEMWLLIKEFNIDYYAVCVSKDLVKKSLKVHKQKDFGTSWIDSSNFYARVDRQLPMDVGINAIYKWAVRQIGPDSRLKVIFEARSGDMFTLRNYEYVTEKSVFTNPQMILFSECLKERVVSISFANKGVRAVGLEIADFIAYTCNIYFLKMKKRIVVDAALKKGLIYKGIHKTLNKRHYVELSASQTIKFIPGLNSRTKRISKYYGHKSALLHKGLDTL